MKKIFSFVLSIALAVGIFSGYADIIVPHETFSITVNAAEISSKPYYYDKITDTQKALYDQLYEAALKCSESSVVTFGVTSKDLTVVANLLYYYDSLMFNVFALKADLYAGKTIVKFKYRYTKYRYDEMVEEINKKADKVIADMPDDLNTYYQLKYIHDYIAENCTYDVKAKDAENPYGLLIGGSGKCDGYSRSFTLLAGKIGVQAVMVIGVDKTKNNTAHMWNKVYYNKKWYNMDVTYDDVVSVIADNVRYNYFMISDEAIKNSHVQSAVDYKVPSATDNSNAYYKIIGAQASSYSDAKKILKKSIVKAAKNNTYIVSVQFASKKEYEKAYKALFEDKDIYTILSDANSSAKNKICTNTYVSSRKDNTYTIDIMFYYPNTSLSMYYRDTSKVDASTKSTLKKYDIK